MAEIYTTQPKIHRSEITSVDTGDPDGISGAVDCRGYAQCRFDLTVGGTEVNSLEVAGAFLEPAPAALVGRRQADFQHNRASRAGGGLPRRRHFSQGNGL